LGHIEDVHCVTVPLSPARIHAHDHLGPVLRLRSAGAGTDFQLGIAEVVGTAEKAAELERVQFTFDGSKLGIEVSAHAGVRLLGEEFLELQGAVHSTSDSVVRLYPPHQYLHRLHDRPPLVRAIPDSGSVRPLLQRRQPSPLVFDVKVTSVARKAVPIPLSVSGYNGYQPLSLF